MKHIAVLLSCLSLALGLFAQNVPTAKKEKLVLDTVLNQQLKTTYFVTRNAEKLIHGPYTITTPDGTIVTEGEYNMGEKDGIWKDYQHQPPFALMASQEYNAGKATGTWVYYYEQKPKQIQKKLSYLKDDEVYAFEKYYEDGALLRKGLMDLKRGEYRKIGAWKSWYENGQKEYEGYYLYNPIDAASFKTGKWQYWHNNGQLMSIENYNSLGQITGKKTIYDKNGKVEKNEYYLNGVLERAEDRFDFQKEELEPLVSSAQSYRLDQPYIYKSEIASITQEYNEYLELEKGDEKYEKGQKLLTKLNVIDENHQAINENDIIISQLATLVDSVYDEKYPVLYKNEVKPFIIRVNIYKEIENVEQKVASGQSLRETLLNMKKSYEAFAELEQYMEATRPTIEANYKTIFPEIYAQEIQLIEPMLYAYRTIGFIEVKHDSAKSLKAFVANLADNYDKLKEINQNVKNNFPRIQKMYEKDYSNLYKTEIGKVSDQIEQYKLIGSITPRIAEGEAILKLYDELSANYEKLNAQKESINTHFEQFENKFKEDKENKHLYKKGRKLYKYYMDRYESAGFSSQMLVVGEDVVVVLKKLTSYWAKDNTYLNGQLKQAKTEPEIMKVIGL